MKSLTIAITLFMIAAMTACNQTESPVASNADPYAANSNANTMVAEDLPYDENDPLIKDNFDLQRAGEYLRRSNNPAEFEAYINEPNGINNLDLNGDGYVDYVSVEEFEDYDDGQRGLSLFARYGPDLIQNIASIFLYRDEPRYPGARVLIRGDEGLYGDNYYYETNWLDTTLGIANLLFGDHDRYESPYYYDYYPRGYTVYEVVETPVYRTRIERLWPEPIFVYAAAPPVYYERIKIKSPNNGLHLGQIYGRPMKPTVAQINFRRGNPGKPGKGRGDGPGRSENAPGQRGVPPGQAKDKDDGPASDKGRGNPGGPPKADGPGGKPDRDGNAGKGQGKGDGPGKGQGQNKGGGPGKGKGKP